MSSPNDLPPPQHPKDEPPSWVPRWMSDRERTAAIIALGAIVATFIFVCGGCCSGVLQVKILEALH